MSRPFAVALVDVDHVKAINDSDGHPVGGQVLSAIAGRLSDRVRSIDVVGRWGGEEFIAVLPDAGPTEASAVAEALRIAGGSGPVMLDGHAVPVTVSVGRASARP